MEMKAYRRFVIGSLSLLALTFATRWALIGPTVAQSRGNPALQQTPSLEASPSQARASRPAAAQQTPGLPAGTAGPTTELLKMMAVDKPDFGIKVVKTFDATGKAAYETKGGDLLFMTNASVSYNSTADKPMVIVINAKTRKIIAVADIDMPSTPHGITLSPDGKYIYLPSGPSTGSARGSAPTAVVNTKTLKLAALINTGGETHHTQIVGD